MHEVTIIVESLREVAKELANRPWSTGTEEALRLVADRIEEKHA